jgi:hypothetical protein
MGSGGLASRSYCKDRTRLVVVGERLQQRVHSELGSLEMEVGQRWGLAGDGAWWGVL